MFWDLNKNDSTYKINIELKSRGLLSPLYRFRGSYAADGFLKNGFFTPISYTQEWITKKKKRNVQIAFKNHKVFSLMQQPIEKEIPRLDVFLLEDYLDPLSSFLKLLSGLSESKTIDGRRIYIFTLIEENKDENKKTYGIKEYNNIWADHKRNDLEKISIIKKFNNYLPEAIYINFKEQLFSIIKN